MRHVSITLRDDGKASADTAEESDDAQSVPAWFVALVHPEKTSVSVPISIPGKTTTLVITSIPNDEIAEIWEGIVTQLAVGSAVAVALFLITMVVVGRALAPLQALSQAMTRIESGAYDVRVEPDGAPELAAICASSTISPPPWALRSRRSGGSPSAPSRCRTSSARRLRANCMTSSGRTCSRCGRMSVR